MGDAAGFPVAARARRAVQKTSSPVYDLESLDRPTCVSPLTRLSLFMFEIETNSKDRMIFLRMAGVLSVDEARACAAAKEAAVDSLGAPFDHCTLVDVRDLRLQPQEVFAIFTSFVAATEHKSRRIAIVGGEGTARMQFRRVAERAPLRNDMRFFTAFDEARDWLKDGAIRPTHAHLARGPGAGIGKPAWSA
jgi:hypothetical protein